MGRKNWQKNNAPSQDLKIKILILSWNNQPNLCCEAFCLINVSKNQAQTSVHKMTFQLFQACIRFLEVADANHAISTPVL